MLTNLLKPHSLSNQAESSTSRIQVLPSLESQVAVKQNVVPASRINQIIKKKQP
jgi:hypothetical protein